LSDAKAALDPCPKTLRKDVTYACEAATIIALTISVELNIYQHVKLGHMPAGIGWTVGIAVPLLVAILSHVAAHVNFHWTLKIWVGGIVAALMFVSASAGIKVLAPAMGDLPAGVASYGLDLAALTTVGVLMYAASQVAALALWEARQEARRLQAEREARERAERAEYEALAARFGRPGNALGNSGGNARGNTAGTLAGNALGLHAGNAGWAALPAAPPPAVVAPAAETVPAGSPAGPLATVTDLPRRPAMSDDEMWALAMKLAGERERVGLDLTVRAFMDEYGGTPKRVAPLVKRVKEARAAGQAAAGT
jgi:hypothetical protein